MPKDLMIIDTDCGVDDALAILLALSCNQVWDVLAITCCNGNTTIDNVCGNVMRLTNFCNSKEIPIYSGCNKSLTNITVQSQERINNVGRQMHQNFHGEDGFGGMAHKYPVGDQKVKSEHAATALVRLVDEHRGEVSLIALGPLTNLAMAKRLDDDFDKKLKELVVMGGTIDAIGNATACGEFNFVTDPEAAYVVINEFVCPIKIFPWETCIRQLIPWKLYGELTHPEHTLGVLIGDLTTHAISYIKSQILRPGYHCPDLLAMAMLVKPSVIKAYESNCPVTVELSGGARGLMIVDRRSANRRGPCRGNIEIITELDMEVLAELLLAMVKVPC